MPQFSKFVDNIRNKCRILDNAAITAYKAAGEVNPIMEHSYRLAAYIAYTVAERSPTEHLDDTDWQDAVNECMLHVPRIIMTWNNTASFNGYAGNAFKTIILQHVWKTTKGGMTKVGKRNFIVAQFTDTSAKESDNASEFDVAIRKDAVENLTYDTLPAGLRDPQEEAQAVQDIDRAIAKFDSLSPQAWERRNRDKRMHNELGK